MQTQKNEESNAKIVEMYRIEKPERWTAILNEFCDDGVIRPVIIRPRKVTCIKGPIQIEIGKYLVDANPGKQSNVGTLIIHDGKEISVFESLDIVIQTLGAVLQAQNSWASLYFSQMVFDEKGIKYCVDVEQLNRSGK